MPRCATPDCPNEIVHSGRYCPQCRGKKRRENTAKLARKTRAARKPKGGSR